MFPRVVLRIGLTGSWPQARLLVEMRLTAHKSRAFNVRSIVGLAMWLLLVVAMIAPAHGHLQCANECCHAEQIKAPQPKVGEDCCHSEHGQQETTPAPRSTDKCPEVLCCARDLPEVVPVSSIVYAPRNNWVSTPPLLQAVSLPAIVYTRSRTLLFEFPPGRLCRSLHSLNSIYII